jgi:H2-forming N5,N10-methylenetetrahydromethanopterin dehydrogenase-like enzyme
MRNACDNWLCESLCPESTATVSPVQTTHKIESPLTTKSDNPVGIKSGQPAGIEKAPFQRVIEVSMANLWISNHTENFSNEGKMFQ